MIAPQLLDRRLAVPRRGNGDGLRGAFVPAWTGRVFALLALAYAGTASVPLGVHAQSAPPPQGVIPGVGAVTPSLAMNSLGTARTVTFACTSNGGCGTVTAKVSVASFGALPAITGAACSGALGRISGASVQCVMTSGGPFSVTINPRDPFVYLISFSGTVPFPTTSGPFLTTAAACGSIGLTPTPGAAFGGAIATCDFSLTARAKFVRFTTLHLSGGSCGGIVAYSQKLDAFFGSPCTLTAEAAGVVNIKQVTTCVGEPTGPAPVGEFGVGATFTCTANILGVMGITAAGLDAVGIPHNLAEIPIGLTVKGPGRIVTSPFSSTLCTGAESAAGGSSMTDHPLTICPAGIGTITAQACATQSPLCSAPFSFATSGEIAVTGKSLTCTVLVACPGDVATFTDLFGDMCSSYAARITWGDGSLSSGTVTGTTAAAGCVVSGTAVYKTIGAVPISILVMHPAGFVGSGTGAATVSQPTAKTPCTSSVCPRAFAFFSAVGISGSIIASELPSGMLSGLLSFEDSSVPAAAIPGCTPGFSCTLTSLTCSGSSATVAGMWTAQGTARYFRVTLLGSAATRGTVIMSETTSNGVYTKAISGPGLVSVVCPT